MQQQEQDRSGAHSVCREVALPRAGVYEHRRSYVHEEVGSQYPELRSALLPGGALSLAGKLHFIYLVSPLQAASLAKGVTATTIRLADP